MGATELFLWRIGLFSRHFDSGAITLTEFVDNLFVRFAADQDELTCLAPEVLVLVPQAARGHFAEKVRQALRPEFRFPPWCYGGGRPRTEEENRQESKLLTARVREWAAEFLRLLLSESCP
jgi:hypothetical protein